MEEADLTNVGMVDIIKGYSINTWNRIELAQRLPWMRVSEVTITQELVFYYYMMARSRKFPVKIFESKDEKLTGNDLEILIEFDDGVVRFPCQAKIISPNGRYKRLNHKVAGTYQIDLLLKYAQKFGGFPLYLFYNYYHRGDINRLEELIGEDEGMQGLWGCTLGSASSIKKRFFKNKDRFTSPHFYDLHEELCDPFYFLMELSTLEDYAQGLQNLFGDIDLKNLKKYPVEEILKDEYYRDLTPRASLGFIPSGELEIPLKSQGSQSVYHPRFRILLSKENHNLTRIVVWD